MRSLLASASHASRAPRAIWNMKRLVLQPFFLRWSNDRFHDPCLGLFLLLLLCRRHRRNRRLPQLLLGLWRLEVERRVRVRTFIFAKRAHRMAASKNSFHRCPHHLRGVVCRLSSILTSTNCMEVSSACATAAEKARQLRASRFHQPLFSQRLSSPSLQAIATSIEAATVRKSLRNLLHFTQAPSSTVPGPLKAQVHHASLLKFSPRRCQEPYHLLAQLPCRLHIFSLPRVLAQGNGLPATLSVARQRAPKDESTSQARYRQQLLQDLLHLILVGQVGVVKPEPYGLSSLPFIFS